MKPTIITLFVIYFTSAQAITEYGHDLRFPVDARKIQGILNKMDLTFVFYELNENKTVVDYFITDTSRSCGSNRIEMDEDLKFAEHFDILPLNQDKILLVPSAFDTKFKQYPVKMEIVDLSSCQRIQIVLPTEEKLTEYQITRYADSFDIYFKDWSACQNNYCRKSYDFEGNLISTTFNEFHSNKSVPLVKPIGFGKRSNKYIAFEFTKENTIVNLVESEKSSILAEITDTKFSPAVSTSHNFITIAYRSDFTNLNLVQFDLEGNLKFETLVKYNHFVRIAKVLNAPNGEVYLVASECDRDHCNDEINVYFVKKFDKTGKELGSLVLKFPLPGIIQDLSFDESKGSYCLSRAQLSLGVSLTWEFKKLDIISKCFTDKDFS